jgi:hypothetical protein
MSASFQSPAAVPARLLARIGSRQPVFLSLCAMVLLCGCDRSVDRKVAERIARLDEEAQRQQNILDEKHERERAELEEKVKNALAAPSKSTDDFTGNTGDVGDVAPIDLGGHEKEPPEVPKEGAAENGGVLPEPGSPLAWQFLRPGLKKDAVRKLLGEPTKKSRDVALEYWHYGRGRDAGHVALTSGGVLWGWEAPIR